MYKRRLVSFNNIPFLPIDAAYEMSVEAHTSTLDIGGTTGEYDLLEGEQVLKNQTYSVEFAHIVNEGCSYPASVDELRGQVGKWGTLRAMFGTSCRQATAKIIAIEDTTTSADVRTGTYRIKCKFVARPYWFEDNQAVVQFTNKTRVICHNAGNALSTDIEITITSVITPALIITNTTTGETVTYDTSKAVGLSLVFSCKSGVVLLNGVNAYGNILLPDTQMSLMTLAPGENNLTFSVLATGVVSYRSCWV